MKTDVPFIDSLHKCSQLPGLGSAKARSLGLNLDLPCKWQGPRDLSYHLIPVSVQLSRKLDERGAAGTQIKHSVIQDVDILSITQLLSLSSTEQFSQPVLWNRK